MRDDEAGTAVPPRPAPRRGGPGWAAVVMPAAGAFTIGTDMFAMAGILGGIARDPGVTVGTAGWAVTVFALASAVGGVLLSALLGARPLRRVLLGALALYGVLSAATALAPAAWWWTRPDPACCGRPPWGAVRPGWSCACSSPGRAGRERAFP